MSALAALCAAAWCLAARPEPRAAAGDSKARFEHPYELDSERLQRRRTGGSALIRGATVHSAVGPAERADVLVQNGKIAAVGRGLEAPEGVGVIEAEGMHLAPGAVDTHSHIAADGSINEGTVSISADCDITDVIDADDLAIYRALAGGTTTIQVLHGSANTIGGRSEVIKLKWKRRADALRFPGAPQGIKFALGENVKRSNATGASERFPSTRMGVEALLVRAFERAQDYRDEWSGYGAARARGEDAPPPRRDVRLEVLAGILEGAVRVHSHCYRADEILMLIRVAERFGVRLQTLQHVLEGYKVASEMAAHGVGGSTFSDWWAYKIEAYDAVPQNAALMDEAGVLSTVNSDSAELMRHLFQEAGKSVRYAGMDRVAALRLATLNGAKQLGLGDRTGSIEVGKDADLALFDGDPLSFRSRVQWTMVDGEIEFERRDAFELESKPCPVSPLAEPEGVAPAPTDGPVVAIVGGTLHPITSPDLDRATLIVRGGRIAAMGRDLAVPAGALVIDAAGRHVWPGMIALNTTVGLREIDSVRGTIDLAEGGGNQPDLRASASIHPESAHVGVTRVDGITRSESAPTGGGPMMGQSAVIELVGETWEEMLTLDRALLHVRFPAVANDAEEKKEPESVKELRRLLADAREYGRVADLAREGKCDAPPYDPRLEALVPYARGERKVALHADNAQTILSALKFAKDEKLAAVLYGASEAWKVIDALAREQVPVAVGPVLSIPSDEHDPYDACYAGPAVLCRAGVPFAIMANDEENTRHLAWNAAMAEAFGLPHEEALRAVTFYPARILGLEKELGSLAVGKRADVVVTDGDLLDTTARVLHVLIDGEPTRMENRQTELYRRYRERVHRLREGK